MLVPLDRAGAISGSPRVIDLLRLYAGLEEHFAELNVEGAVVLGKQVCLLNRPPAAGRRVL